MRWAVIVTALAVSGCPVTQPQDTPVDARQILEPQTGRNYWLYVPSYYSDEHDWPLVVTLHGSNVWDGPVRQIMEWKALAERCGFLVAAPRVYSAEGILPVLERIEQLREDEKAVLSILDNIAGQYRVDPRAVLLTGFSAGGYPMYWIGLRHPERFNMLIARACNSSVEHLERIPLTDEARKMPIMIFWGKDDLAPIRRESWAAFRWLREHRCFGTEKKEVEGGHLRRPELAFRFWLEHLPKRHRRRMR